MSMTRRRLLDNTFKKSVVGNPAIATDSLARMYPGIEMQGWTTQDGTPTPEAPVPIVSAGTKNQENGKWEYEITIANAQTDPDKNQTVTLTADRPLTKWDKLTKKDGQLGWEYKSAEIESYTDESVPGEYYSTTGQLSVGAQVWYETTTETFAPITASEQEQMNALYTYRPTTVLSNQQDCEMALTYKTRKGVGGGNPYGLEFGGFVTADGGEAGANPQIRIRTGYIPYISGQIFQMKAPIRYRIKYILFYESNKTTDSFVETKTLSIVGEGSYTMPENSGKYFRLSIEKIDNTQAMTDQDLEDLKRNLIMIVR